MDGAPGGARDNAELLAAGAVLPPGARDAGASAVDLTARTYRHPVLGEDRVVVRLAAAELGPAEDLAAGFLGLEPHGEPAVVGLGRRQELGFPEWVLVHHPEDGHHALAVVPELDRLARQARTKPKAALDACLELADRLASAVPHFLPVFYEQAARVFLGVENTTYAGQLFARARTSEAQHGLAVDEDRLDAVFLEFALVGALPVKVLTGYGKELAARLAPTEAYERFRRLCVRRTAGGLAPSAQATTELRRLARAAGLSAAEAEQDYLAELLPLPATLRAAEGWWKTH
ncbi:DNA-binding protein, partial [Streptomyces sp. SID2131]|nr:DNA-binding protein [Streptomyces sp. SID2131]